MIVGIQTNSIAVCLDPDESLENLSLQIGQAVEKVDRGAGVLILVDLFGGTPSNAASLSMSTGHAEVVTGMNLGMVLEVMSGYKGRSLPELAAVAERSGRKSIVNIGKRLRRKASAE